MCHRGVGCVGERRRWTTSPSRQRARHNDDKSRTFMARTLIATRKGNARTMSTATGHGECVPMAGRDSRCDMRHRTRRTRADSTRPCRPRIPHTPCSPNTAIRVSISSCSTMHTRLHCECTTIGKYLLVQIHTVRVIALRATRTRDHRAFHVLADAPTDETQWLNSFIVKTSLCCKCNHLAEVFVR
jgi:hypothetical protein